MWHRLGLLLLAGWPFLWLGKKRVSPPPSCRSACLSIPGPQFVSFATEAPPQTRLGEILVGTGLATPEQITQALELQSKCGSRLGDIVLSMGWMKPMAFYRALADHFRLRFVNLLEEPVDSDLVDQNELQMYAERLFLPWRKENGVLWFASADPSRVPLKIFALPKSKSES